MIANSPIPADVPLASPETGPIIEVRDLVKTFGRRTVLNGISFKVLQGETMVIMGGSGCGKSTILRHLIGSMKPDAGSIRIFGEEITGMDQQGMDRIQPSHDPARPEGLHGAQAPVRGLPLQPDLPHSGRGVEAGSRELGDWSGKQGAWSRETDSCSPLPAPRSPPGGAP